MIAEAIQVENVFLLPGQLVFTREPQRITTILGSCVTVTMFDPRYRTAAMCHAMLPHPPAANRMSSKRLTDPFRYVSEALPAMVAYFKKAGSLPAMIDVKIFGGARVLHLSGSRQGGCADGTAEPIGDANVRFARALLQDASFSVTASNVGGTSGRKIIFETYTGEMLHRFLC